MNTDTKLTQLKTWLNTYLTVARAYLKAEPAYDLKLYFITAPPEVITVHCSTSDYRQLNMQNNEFLYNGPPSASSSIVPQLFCLKSGTLVPVLNYAEYFSATLISINPEYSTTAVPIIKAQNVVVMDYVDRQGGQLSGPLLMPPNWVPSNKNELVPMSYVDQLRLDLEERIALLENA